MLVKIRVGYPEKGVSDTVLIFNNLKNSFRAVFPGVIVRVGSVIVHNIKNVTVFYIEFFLIFNRNTLLFISLIGRLGLAWEKEVIIFIFPVKSLIPENFGGNR